MFRICTWYSKPNGLFKRHDFFALAKLPESGRCDVCGDEIRIADGEPVFKHMPDQAQGLRNLVSTRGKSKIQEVLEELELSDDGTTHESFEVTNYDRETGTITLKDTPEVRTFLGKLLTDEKNDLKRIGSFEPMRLNQTDIDKAKLWDQLKSELEGEASRVITVTGADVQRDRVERSERSFPTVAAREAMSMLQRMEQAETFARVRGDMRGRA